MEFAPTPLMLLEKDARGNEIWVKREDLLPYSFGGNKVRIGLELMADMAAKGCDHMIAYGNARSNLCRVLSNLCAGAGLPCTLLSPADDDGSREPSYNELLCRGFGAEILPCEKTNVAGAVEAALEESRRRGRKPYYLYGNIQGTGNREAPARAYRKVWRELLRQQQSLGFAFDELYLAAGTGMTQAGLMAGRLLDGDGPRIHGISIARTAAMAKQNLTAYGQALLAELPGPAPLWSSALGEVKDDYRVQYGRSTPEMENAVRRAMIRFGLPLDLTYTGKAFYGMTQELQRQEMENRRVLFLHTGGTPLFFDKAGSVLVPPQG